MYWANRLAYEPLMEARALLQGAASGAPATDVIAAFLGRDPDEFDHNKAVGKAADAGTLAHAMIEAHLLDKDPAACITPAYTPDMVSKAESSFLAFLEWAGQTNLKVVETETSLVSETYQFGGTLDAGVLTINDKLAIGDWKTSSGVYPDHLIQLAAYQMLWDECRPDRPITGGLHLFRFSKDTGDFHHHFFQDLNKGADAFLHCLALYNLDKDLKKRAK
jgi:hypothetical protein